MHSRGSIPAPLPMLTNQVSNLTCQSPTSRSVDAALRVRSLFTRLPTQPREHVNPTLKPNVRPEVVKSTFTRDARSATNSNPYLYIYSHLPTNSFTLKILHQPFKGTHHQTTTVNDVNLTSSAEFMATKSDELYFVNEIGIGLKTRL